MSDGRQTIEKRFYLLSGQAERLQEFALTHRTNEDLVVGRALDILFSLIDLLDDSAERRGWSALSGDALAGAWENDSDAAYDNWRELYGVPAG